MRKLILLTTFLFCVFTLQAQTDYNIKAGDLLVLGEPSGSSYKAIAFPKKNIIIKRGAIANFNDLVGKKLVVKQIENSNGSETLILKRDDDMNFFRFFPTVKADLAKALELGELKTLPYNGQNAIAQQ